jgi:Bacterial lipid A biosynthesis acyltransferase
MTLRDVRDIGKLAALALIAWLLPPRLWRKAAMATRSIGEGDPYSPAYRQILAQKYSEPEIADIGTRGRAYRRELRLQILGLDGPWRSWRPDICLNGTIHIRRALERGHGAILWVTETAFSTLIVKMALHDAGCQAYQLSRPGHGFSASPFGIRFLNPLWTRVEDRFIADRVLIIGENGAEALAVLRERLSRNQIVMITVGTQAHKLVQVPFVNCYLQLPTGPIALARATGAGLLPVFAVTQESGRFKVSIQEALNPTGSPANDDSIAAAYAKRLELFVLEYPDQWNGWRSLQKNDLQSRS